MEALSNKLDQIELKLRKLALKIERLEKTNSVLLEENQRLKAEKATGGGTKANSSELEMRLAEAQKALLTKRAEDPEESRRLRKEIEQYINEIDKCIEWLNAN